MKLRCNPQMVIKTYRKTRTWRRTATELNQLYDVSLSPATWRDYAKGNHDIADPETRARLLLGPRVCPGCGRKHTAPKSPRQAKQKPIRKYGYPVKKVKSFDEVLKLREAMR